MLAPRRSRSKRRCSSAGSATFRCVRPLASAPFQDGAMAIQPGEPLRHRRCPARARARPRRHRQLRSKPPATRRCPHRSERSRTRRPRWRRAAQLGAVLAASRSSLFQNSRAGLVRELGQTQAASTSSTSCALRRLSGCAMSRTCSTRSAVRTSSRVAGRRRSGRSADRRRSRRYRTGWPPAPTAGGGAAWSGRASRTAGRGRRPWPRSAG